MNRSSGRFNLRQRKSVKLFGQIECSSCKRYYFPTDNSDEEEESETKTNKICCDCEERAQNVPPPKRRVVQRKNDISATTQANVKQERIDSANFPVQNNVFEHLQRNEKENTQQHCNNMNTGNTVPIHSVQVFAHTPATSKFMIATTNELRQKTRYFKLKFLFQQISIK